MLLPIFYFSYSLCGGFRVFCNEMKFMHRNQFRVGRRSIVRRMQRTINFALSSSIRDRKHFNFGELIIGREIRWLDVSSPSSMGRQFTYRRISPRGKVNDDSCWSLRSAGMYKWPKTIFKNYRRIIENDSEKFDNFQQLSIYLVLRILSSPNKYWLETGPDKSPDFTPKKKD